MNKYCIPELEMEDFFRENTVKFSFESYTLLRDFLKNYITEDCEKTSCKKEKTNSIFDELTETLNNFTNFKKNNKKSKTSDIWTSTEDYKFRCETHVTDNGNFIVHWTYDNNGSSYEGFGSKGVSIAKHLKNKGILPEECYNDIVSIHNTLKNGHKG